MLLIILVALASAYAGAAVFIAKALADMNHLKRPMAAEWGMGVFWLPIVILLVFAHYWYKVRK